ncbi:MAG: hypothetical protein C4538_06390, partial [Nitrospiraceae bacterium]
PQAKRVGNPSAERFRTSRNDDYEALLAYVLVIAFSSVILSQTIQRIIDIVNSDNDIITK